MNQPDPAEIEKTPEEMATDYLAMHNDPGIKSSHPLSAHGKAVIERLLAALATAEKERDLMLDTHRHCSSLRDQLAAAEAVVEAAEPISKWLGKGIGGENNAKKLFDALANYHKATGPQAAPIIENAQPGATGEGS